MSELLVKVEMMAQYIELYEDEVHIQMPLSLVRVIKLKDITDVDFKKANFVVAGKLIIKYKEKGASQSATYTFNFFLNDGMQALVSMMDEQRLKLSGDAGQRPEVVVKEVIKVRCQYCEGLMDEKDDMCPVCGRPR